MKQDSKAEFEVTSQLCLAINNIDFVLKYIRPFVGELGIDDIVEKLRVLNGDLVASSCKRTLVHIFLKIYYKLTNLWQHSCQNSVLM